MPVVINELISAAGGGSASDIFLSVQTKRAGKVKGEAVTPGHEDDILVKAWHWGVSAGSAIGSVQANSRRSYTGLTVVKGIDSATTALMSAMVTNDEVKEAKLTMRRAGGEQIDYLLITLKGGRISQLEHRTDASGEALETLTVLFTKVEVEYRPQKTTGLKGGSFVFNDEILPAA
jgi:type VI secretion system secreted protein Hcp